MTWDKTIPSFAFTKAMSLIETEFSARESNKPAKKKSEQPLASTYEAKTPRLDRNGSVKPTAGAGKAKESMGIFHFKKIYTATTACFQEKKLYFANGIWWLATFPNVWSQYFKQADASKYVLFVHVVLLL